MCRSAGLALLVCLALAGCSAAMMAAPDAHEDDAASVDAALADTTIPDAAVVDAGVDAAIEMDAGVDDASVEDASDAATDDAPIVDDAAMPEDASPLADVGPIDGGILRTEDPPTHPVAPPIARFVSCRVTTATDAISGAEHHLPCDTIDYPYHPPSAGPHYSQWAAFQTYTAPVPPGFLVHAMEHGAVILSYHCATDADCDPVRAAFATIVADRGLDDVCRDEDTPQRIIIVPDPTLTVPIAATAWEHVYTATCLDEPSLRAFIDAHYAMAPENFCFPGVDLSSTGWCP
jgi:hypothetical protein